MKQITELYLEKNQKFTIFIKKIKVFTYFPKGEQLNILHLKKNFQKINCLLDEEGPLINFIYDADFTARTNSLVLNKLSDYYCWGTKDFGLMAKVLKKNKLILSGHPKFDLCNKKYVSYFNNQKKKLKNKYGDFLLVASNFVAADGYIENDIYKEWIVKAVEKKLRKRKSKDLKNYFNTDQIYYDRLIDFTKKISTQHPNLNIVFRPHPRQDIDKVKKRFDKKI